MTNTTDTPAAALRAWAREAQALAEQATPGPWEVEKEIFQLNELGNKQREGKESSWTYTEHPVYYVQTSWKHGQAQAKLWIAGHSYSPYFEGTPDKLHWNTEPGDPEFIAAARTLVPQLARAVVTLVEALEDAAEGLHEMRGYVPEYFAQKWNHDDYIDRVDAALAAAAKEATT